MIWRKRQSRYCLSLRKLFGRMDVFDTSGLNTGIQTAEDVYNADVSTSILESVGDAYKDGRRHVSCTAGKIQLDWLRRG